MFGSDYYGCLGCDQKFGDEVCQPTVVEYFGQDSVKQVSCGDCHVVVLAGNMQHKRMAIEQDMSMSYPITYYFLLYFIDSGVYSWGNGEQGWYAKTLFNSAFSIFSSLFTSSNSNNKITLLP